MYAFIIVLKWEGTIFYNVFVRGMVPLDPTLVIYRGNCNLTLTASKLLCDIPFMRSHKARHGHCPSEAWTFGAVNTAVPQVKTLGRTVSPCPTWFTPLPASLASLHANWLVALSLTFHANAVCFKYLTGGPADPAWCWLIVLKTILGLRLKASSKRMLRMR